MTAAEQRAALALEFWGTNFPMEASELAAKVLECIDRAGYHLVRKPDIEGSEQ